MSIQTNQPVSNTKTMKPFYWSMFGAGGMVAALALPTLIILLSFALPFGVLGDAAGFYQMMHSLMTYQIIYFGVAALLFAMLWHCVHRFYYCLHDCQVHVGTKTRWALYLFAIAAFLITLWA